MKIKNLKVYGLPESIIRSGYPMQVGEPEDIIDEDNIDLLSNDYKRASKLAKAPVGSGHDNFLIGINVQFDLCYPQYWTKHLQRYHWFQYFSGQSLMHKLTSVKDVKDNCNKWVMDIVIESVNELISYYNDERTIYPFSPDGKKIANTREDLFHMIISNCPLGYELWIPVTTNYMQLKTMYNQRKTHKLYDWKEFCKWIQSLPLAEQLILI